jgi:hypothetical protein
MRKRMITDAEAEQLLAGTTPEGRPELAALAASIADVRAVSTAAAPQLSAALAARLESPVPAGAVADAQPARGIRKMVASIAGLGVAAKVAAASGVLALGLVGVGAAGAAGALPAPAQEVFDDVITTVLVTEDDTLTEGETDGTTDEGVVEECVVDGGTTDGTTDEGLTEEELEADLYGTAEESTEGTTDGSTDGTADETTDETTDGTTECVEPLPVGSKEFSDWVREGAQDPDKVGRDFGQSVSEQARELRGEKAEERAENGQGNNGNGQGNRPGSGEDDGEDDDAADTSTERGKPAGTPGGGRP